MMKFKHPFHLVDPSPWPLLASLSAMILVLGLTNLFYDGSMTLLGLGLVSIIFNKIQWWRDVVRESTFQGLHSLVVKSNMKWGMMLFITSEVLFFFSFFWAYFHFSLSPAMEVGAVWPPTGVQTFNMYDVPLLNTVILLSSGVTVTWAHHSIINSEHVSSTISLSLTVILGIYFTMLQTYEYFSASFSISESCYGSAFFVATGFHGLHVIIGTLFLLVCLKRVTSYHFSNNHHFGFEAAAWYWHFVDVVWLFLFSSIYWWGG